MPKQKPHVLICLDKKLTEAKSLRPQGLLLLLERHQLLRVVRPWDGKTPLLVGDLAITNVPRPIAWAEVRRLRDTEVRARIVDGRRLVSALAVKTKALSW